MRMYMNIAIGAFDVEFRRMGFTTGSEDNLSCIIHRRVLQRTETWINEVIDTCTSWRRQVYNEALFSRLIFLLPQGTAVQQEDAPLHPSYCDWMNKACRSYCSSPDGFHQGDIVDIPYQENVASISPTLRLSRVS